MNLRQVPKIAIFIRECTTIASVKNRPLTCTFPIMKVIFVIGKKVL